MTVYAYHYVCQTCHDEKQIFTDIKRFPYPEELPCEIPGCWGPLKLGDFIPKNDAVVVDARRAVHNYKCPACGATKEIVDDLSRNGNKSLQTPPNQVPCGWRGCSSFALRQHT